MDNRYRLGDIVFNDWRIEQMLGSGSLSRVYKISKTLPGLVSYAALKVITLPPPAEGDGFSFASPERIMEEYALMYRLRGCSHVVRCEDIQQLPHDKDAGCDILIRMELLTPLPQYKKGCLPDEAEAVRLGIQLCRALEECNRLHLTYRDVKPDNILVSPNGCFKLGDFGIVQVMKESMDSAGVGVKLYAAPEVACGRVAGVRRRDTADLYSLGIVLYQLLNHGRLPFLAPYPQPLRPGKESQALARRNQGEALPPPDSASSALAGVVLKACAYQATERWQSAKEMRQALEAITFRQPEPGYIAAPGE